MLRLALVTCCVDVLMSSCAKATDCSLHLHNLIALHWRPTALHLITNIHTHVTARQVSLLQAWGTLELPEDIKEQVRSVHGDLKVRLLPD